MQILNTSNGRKPRISRPIRAVASVVLFGGLLLGCGCRQKPGAATSTSAANDGLPRTLTELNAWYVEPPVGQNAATFYSQGFDALQTGKVESSPLPFLGKGTAPPLGSPLPASMKSTLAAILQSNRTALDLFAQGTRCEKSRYPVDLALGVDALFPHLPKVRMAVKLTQLSAILHAEAGDGKQAATDVLTSLGLVRSLDAEPSTISQSMRASVVPIAAAALERAVNRSALPQESLRALAAAFQKMEDYDARGEGFNRALAGERLDLAALLATPQKLLELLPAMGADLSPGEREEISARLQSGRKLTAEREYCEATFRQLLAIRKTAWPARSQAGDFIRQRVAQAGKEKLAILVWLLPGLAGQVNREAECLASLRLGLTAIALEQFRAGAASHYPDSLSELSPKYLPGPPVDPFDGQGLRYRKKGGGYLLYSIGPDLTDDSGQRMKEKKGDIVFEVIAPAKAGT